MKKVFFLITALCLTLSACLPAVAPTEAANPAPVSEVDLQATVAISVEQTLQSLPTPTLAPSETPVIAADTNTPTQVPTPTPTGTQNPLLLTLTATLGTGTVVSNATAAVTGTPGALTATPNPAISATPTETLHSQHYGTMPPNLPYGYLTLYNNSRAEVYISLQCTTNDGYVTIIEFPVGRKAETSAPVGSYVYVAWVGGNKITGSFRLYQTRDLTLTIYANRIEVK